MLVNRAEFKLFTNLNEDIRMLFIVLEGLIFIGAGCVIWFFMFKPIKNRYEKRLRANELVIKQLDLQRKILAICLLSTSSKTMTHINFSAYSLIIPYAIDMDVNKECLIQWKGSNARRLGECICDGVVNISELNEKVERYLNDTFPKWNLCLPK